jgi:hypothetical protein
LDSWARQREWTDAFVQRLRELGWIEGRTVVIEYRRAAGRTERLADIVAELVRLKVDVICTHSAEPVLAAKQAASVIPSSSARRRTSAADSSRVWRDRAATSPACRSSSPISLESDSNFCARLSPVSVG